MDTSPSGRTKKDRLAFLRKDWLAFDRADFVGAKVVLGVAVVGSVLFGLVGPVVEAFRSSPLPVSYTTKVTRGFVLPRGATHDGFATMDLLLRDATIGERLTQAKLRDDVEGLV